MRSRSPLRLGCGKRGEPEKQGGSPSWEVRLLPTSSPTLRDWPGRRHADLRVLQLEGNLEIALKDV